VVVFAVDTNHRLPLLWVVRDAFQELWLPRCYIIIPHSQFQHFLLQVSMQLHLMRDLCIKSYIVVSNDRLTLERFIIGVQLMAKCYHIFGLIL
jgi:hypothetical protein